MISTDDLCVSAVQRTESPRTHRGDPLCHLCVIYDKTLRFATGLSHRCCDSSDLVAWAVYGTAPPCSVRRRTRPSAGPMPGAGLMVIYGVRRTTSGSSQGVWQRQLFLDRPDAQVGPLGGARHEQLSEVLDHVSLSGSLTCPRQPVVDAASSATTSAGRVPPRSQRPRHRGKKSCPPRTGRTERAVTSTYTHNDGAPQTPSAPTASAVRAAPAALAPLADRARGHRPQATCSTHRTTCASASPSTTAPSTRPSNGLPTPSPTRPRTRPQRS